MTVRVCVCVCVRACVRACMRACVRVCARACARARAVASATVARARAAAAAAAATVLPLPWPLPPPPPPTPPPPPLPPPRCRHCTGSTAAPQQTAQKVCVHPRGRACIASYNQLRRPHLSTIGQHRGHKNIKHAQLHRHGLQVQKCSMQKTGGSSARPSAVCHGLSRGGAGPQPPPPAWAHAHHCCARNRPS